MGFRYSLAFMKDMDVQVRRGRDVALQPQVSIIIPAYNASKYIAEALDSVFSQTFQNYEIIVVNDGSTDTQELENVLAPYRCQIVYARQENRGVAGARNTALRLTQAPFIALLDSDDLWMPNYLDVQMRIIESDPTIDVLYPNALIFGDSPDAGRKFMELSPSNGEVTFETLVLQECNVMVSVTARRESIISAGYFDESLKSSEDFDLWLRIIKKGGRIAYHQRTLVRYRRRPDSLSANPIWMYQHVLEVLGKMERTHELTESEHLAVIQATERFSAGLALCEGRKAFFQGNAVEAIEKLSEANRFLKKGKLAFLISTLRIAPGIALSLYHLRDRLHFGSDTRFEVHNELPWHPKN